MTPEERGAEIARWWEWDASAPTERNHAARIAAAVREAVAEEREACAALAETYGTENDQLDRLAEAIAVAIRARGAQPPAVGP